MPENCGFSAVDPATGKLKPASVASPKHRHKLNGGTFVLRPSESQFETLMHVMNTDPTVPSWTFFEQDLLTLVYRDKWIHIPHIYNAMKPLRECHSNLWRDEDIKVLHYILQKPWQSRTVTKDTIGITHQLWWDAYAELESNWHRAGNATRDQLWKDVVEPQVAPKESGFDISSVWEKVALPHGIIGRQLPGVLGIFESFKTTEFIPGYVFLLILGGVLYGLYLGGTSIGITRRGNVGATRNTRKRQ